jgi:hypothetical protein
MMKNTLSFLVTIALALPVLAQASINDKIFKHSGERIEGKISRIDTDIISYTIPSESVERSIGRWAVSKIEYANGKTENISDEIIVKGKKDWQKVMIVRNQEAVSGLIKGDEISAKTPQWSLSTISKRKTDEKSSENLRKSAASGYHAPIVLLTSDHADLKKGTIYTYH